MKKLYFFSMVVVLQSVAFRAGDMNGKWELGQPPQFWPKVWLACSILAAWLMIWDWMRRYIPKA